MPYGYASFIMKETKKFGLMSNELHLETVISSLSHMTFHWIN